ALAAQLTEENADRIGAHLVVEGANGPTTAAADRILRERGVVVVPDILANAGGVVVSHAEWVQNLQAVFWDADRVDGYLRRTLVRAFDAVWSLATNREVSPRQAAYML